MSEGAKLLLIVFTMVFTENYVLVQFVAICPFLGVSQKFDSCVGMSGAVIFVMTLASAATYLIYTYVMVPLGLAYLSTIIFILVIAALVQFVEMFLKKSVPSLYSALGIYLPLITTNCAVLGVALLSINERHNFIQSIIYGFGAACGFSLVLILFAAMRERLVAADVPAPFRGVSIAMVTAGLMSLAFMGFTGLIKI